MALFARFFGRTASEGAAYAFGVATGPVLAPATEAIRQEAWQHYATRALSWGDVAGIVAEGVEKSAWGAEEVLRTGLNAERFQALLGEALSAPGIGELYAMWRRGEIDDADFAHGLRKAKIETRWDAPLRALHDVLLTPADLANAVVQGHMGQDAAAAEAALQGVTGERFGVLVNNTGLPPGPETLMAWWRRGIIDTAQLEQGIREGHTKTKYIPFFEEARQPLLSAATAVRLYLKGWYSKAQRDALGALWGYSSAQMEDWFLSEGRPASVHQIHLGYARGAHLPGAANEEEAIRTSVRQSDIRPEYADILYAQRYSLPSAFVLRGLVTSGDLSAQDGENLLRESGWPPDLAAKVAAGWAGGTGGAAADAHLAKAQTTAWTKAQASYIAREATVADVQPILAALAIPAGAQTEIVGLWDRVRTLIRAQLSPAQVKKAYAEQVLNPATNAPWSLGDAIQALRDRGYSENDARTLLSE